MTDEQETPRVSDEALRMVLDDLVYNARQYIAEDFVPGSTYEVFGIVTRRLHTALEALEARFQTDAPERLATAKLSLVQDLNQALAVLTVHLAQMATDDIAAVQEAEAARLPSDPDGYVDVQAACLEPGCGFTAKNTDEAEIHYRETGHGHFRQEDGSDLLFDKELADALASLPSSTPKCAHCGKPATCFGSYEGHPEAYACDECCGHGNEDGHCEPIAEAAQRLREEIEQAARDQAG